MRVLETVTSMLLLMAGERAASRRDADKKGKEIEHNAGKSYGR